LKDETYPKRENMLYLIELQLSPPTSMIILRKPKRPIKWKKSSTPKGTSLDHIGSFPPLEPSYHKIEICPMVVWPCWSLQSKSNIHLLTTLLTFPPNFYTNCKNHSGHKYWQPPCLPPKVPSNWIHKTLLPTIQPFALMHCAHLLATMV
jgi:hypothetical protein